MEKLKILLVTGLLTAEHQGRIITQKIRELLEATGRFEVVITEEFRNITPAYLEPYDAFFIIPAFGSIRIGRMNIESCWEDIAQWIKVAEDVRRMIIMC